MTDSELLKKLLEDHFYVTMDNELEWSYREGVTLNDVDLVLASNAILRLKQYQKERENI